MSNLKIELDISQSPVLKGRKEGGGYRALYGLDSIDASKQKVEIRIPDGTYAITASFFRGMFERSVIAARTDDFFFYKFQFVTTDPQIMKSIKGNVRLILMEFRIGLLK